MNSHTDTSPGAAPLVVAGQRSQTLIAAALAFVFGIGLVYTTGFAHSSTMHNAAHDTRHALSFPCH